MSSQNREDWPLVPFGDLVELSQNGCGIRRGTSGNHTVVLRLADVSLKGEIASSGLRKVQLDSEIREKYSLKHDDLLVIRVNGSRSIAGHIVRYSGPEGYVFCDHFIRFRLKKSLLDPKFAAAAFKSRFLRSQVEAGIVSSAGQNTVSQKTYSEILVPLPSLNGQRRIVASIEALQRRTRRARQALDAIPPLIEKFRQSVLASAFRGDLTADWREQNPDVEPASGLVQRIREEREDKALAATGTQQARYWNRLRRCTSLSRDEVRSLPALPKAWVWARVNETGGVQLGRQRAPRHHKGPNMRPYLRVANVFEARLDLTDIMEMNFSPAEAEIYRLEVGDILLNEGQSLDLVGRPAIYRGEIQGACFTNTLIRYRPAAGVDPRYALAVFRCYMHTGRFRKIASQTTNIAHLGADRFANLEFPLPPEAEQLEISRRVDLWLDRIVELEERMRLSIDLLSRLDQSILAKAFRGELVPQDPNDKPASVLLERIRAEKASQEPRRKRRRSSASPRSKPAQLEMFEERAEPARTSQQPSPDASDATPDEETDVSQWVKDWFSENPGWHARADVMAAVEIDVGAWNRAIEELLASGEVERTGEKRGTRYRFRGDDRSLVAWWFAEHPGWHSRQEVLEDLEIDAGTWNPAIRELVAEGEVVRTGEKRGTRYRWWEDEEGE